MRAEFIEELALLAAEDERILLLTGDLGYMALEPFIERHPERFVNAGAAEQNMVGMATGLAEAGFVPFVYSIATFASLRPFEFIRNGPVLHGLPVRVVGVGGGFEYGHNGLSHYSLEDLAVMRSQPELAVVVPADGLQARAAVRATRDLEGPAYFRVGKGAGEIPELGGRFELGKLQLVGGPGDVTVLSIGSTVRAALDAREMLAEQGIEARVALVPGFTPSPDEEVAELAAASALVVTVESHYVNGGLGSYVAEIVAERGVATRLLRIGVESVPRGRVGPQAVMEHRHGLDAQGIARRVRQAIVAK